jgi:acylphosphatase
MGVQIRAEFVVSGNVQGVGFRYFVYQHARILGIKGFARNQWDGSVYVVVEGDKESVETLHKYLQRGPMMAFVESVDVEYSKATEEFNGFEIK